MPSGNLIGAEEEAEKEFSLMLGKLREERVQDADVFAESEPATPGAVPVLVCFRLYRVIDDSVVRRTCSTKDKILSSSGESLKCCGMS